MPVKTGIHEHTRRTTVSDQWTPAFAGVTIVYNKN